ncbi:16S rRNA (cytosine(1402)-N(4))-methyltransferase RsmH [Methylobacter sp. Wu8]|uniref:Ribosomal RNA small subunit methyltransferase H n=1 Tax=Methylobacter tundripaludum TaxID=173365 RepID=A0A2S6H430_9GAMM|nr:16S rRNA (cytosine(1402)-N(4))-methyltransferase RsmH [Methylobacter tundripaludum]MCF7964276.1 16S rRNA (cytosine(1402)-N(4))-methyltransferase RsmH [Methylobacter tundripaludum]MCK9637902.1 16S rRNA (cytosine(1402)-N(4))-methyltransferase RsmH [Methylobacter tundripaludum]PPK72235.1 16S rRNA (cytosine1402-N4)-methyltransferase [Methylobacter tundripaludum]
MEHLPVMFAEALQQLAIKEDGVYLDCTFGRGGHSQGILSLLGPSGRLLAFDRDLEAINSDYAQAMLEDKRFKLIHTHFSELENIVISEGLAGKIDGILMDLGVSSPQLDNPERGFSFLRDGPLDMRMDGNAGITAEQWLTGVDEKELVKVLFEYGEERFARRIAHAIVEKRAESPLTTTRELAKLIEDAVPVKEKHKHPATRSFQAIRIEINSELDELKAVLQQSVRLLKPGGRLVVISFHSLEDRIVKRFIRSESGAKYNPGKLPIKEMDITKGILKKAGKALKAGPQEIVQNPRARSAIMRVAERV